MPVLGVIPAGFHLGECRLTADLIVFGKLGVPLLLGVNAIAANGLVINGFDGTVSVDPRAAGGRLCCAKAARTREERATLASTPDHGVVGCSPTREGPVQAVAGVEVPAERIAMIHTSGREYGPAPWSSGLRAAADYVVQPGCRGHLLLEYDHHHPVGNVSIGVVPADTFYGMEGVDMLSATHQSGYNRNAFLHVFNKGSNPLVIARHDLLAHAAEVKSRFPGPDRSYSRAPRPPRTMKVSLVLDSTKSFEDGGPPTERAHLHALGFDLEESIDPQRPRATGKEWMLVGDRAPKGCSRFRCEELAGILATRTLLSEDEHSRLVITPVLGEQVYVEADGLFYRPKPDTYHKLTEEQKDRLYRVAMRWWWVWSRDARTPEMSRLVVIDIPTGDSAPVAQKPYPLPYAYRDAVIDELRKLLAGGLIEPSISQWASPVLVRLKKDSSSSW